MNASRIISKLYQGAIPPEGPWLACNGFRLLVLCAKEYQPSRSHFPNLCVIHAPNDDSGRPPTPREITIARHAAEYVAHAVRSGHRTLVTCAMGLNRSGLVTALALCELTGAPPWHCVDLVRKKRPGALQNPHFVRTILAQDRALLLPS